MAARGIADLPRVGNALCLDLVNVVEPRIGPVDRDHLVGYGDLVAWARTGGLLTAEEAELLLRRAATVPNDAVAAVRRAIDLREELHAVFAPIAAGDQPSVADLRTLSATYASYLQRVALRRRGERFEWAWDAVGSADLETAILGPVAASGVELLRQGPLDRIKSCPVEDGGCGWLFLDTTKNRSRRWCSMADCGATVKARRHYARRRGADAGTNEDTNG